MLSFRLLPCSRVVTRRTGLALAGMFLAALPSFGQASHPAIPPAPPSAGRWNPDVEARVAAFADALRQAQEIPAIALAVVSGDGVVMVRGFGTMGLDRPEEPAGQDAVFPAGALMQGFVATVLVQLEEEGRIDLDAPVAKLLPGFGAGGHGSAEEEEVGGSGQEDGGKDGEGSGEDGGPGAITVRELLTLRSGLPDTDAIQTAMAAGEAGGSVTDRLLAAIRNTPLVAKPGKAYAYSLPAFDVAAAAAARVAGKPFEELVAERILEPLGMTSTGFDTPRAGRPRGGSGAGVDPEIPPGRRVTLHSRAIVPSIRKDGESAAARVRDGLPSMSLHTTAGDLARWVLANLHEGAFRRGVLPGDGEGSGAVQRILPRARYEEVWKPYFGVVLGGQETWIGLSWLLGVHGTSYLVRQSSRGFGHAAAVAMLPDKGLGVVLLASADWADLTPAREGVLDLLLGKEPAAPLPSIDVPLRHALAEKGIGAALARYGELEQSSRDQYDFGEDALNRLGYDLLALARPRDAIRILQRNADAFPKSSNARDSLGEAYARAGMKELAIKSYEQALRIDPEARNARRRLRELKEKPEADGRSRSL